jgi:ComF family protein
MPIGLDLIFPRRCAGCGVGAWPFCDACRPDLEPLQPPWCTRCGGPAADDVPSCGNCPPPPLTAARAAFRYAGPARRAVHRLKFSGWRDVASALADAMVVTAVPVDADVITWVPLARRRRAERGYDQARALATAVSSRLDVPARRLLGRPVATGSQARRGGADRRAAVRGAFVPVRTAPARVLLVDDVLTTGATAAACAEALVAAGAREVAVLAAARSLRAPALHATPDRAYPRSGPRPGLWLPGDHPR